LQAALIGAEVALPLLVADGAVGVTDVALGFEVADGVTLGFGPALGALLAEAVGLAEGPAGPKPGETVGLEEPSASAADDGVGVAAVDGASAALGAPFVVASGTRSRTSSAAPTEAITSAPPIATKGTMLRGEAAGAGAGGGEEASSAARWMGVEGWVMKP
jgi:hypothetical protein